MAKNFNLGIADAPFIAGEDLSASHNQYRFVYLTCGGTAGASGSPDKVKLATGASLPIPIGVLQNSPCENEEAQVRLIGCTRLRCSTAVDANNNTSGSPIYQGNFLISGSSGMGIKSQWISGCYAASPILARALEDVLTASAIINALLLPGNYFMAAS